MGLEGFCTMVSFEVPLALQSESIFLPLGSYLSASDPDLHF